MSFSTNAGRPHAFGAGFAREDNPKGPCPDETLTLDPAELEHVGHSCIGNGHRRKVDDKIAFAHPPALYRMYLMSAMVWSVLTILV